MKPITSQQILVTPAYLYGWQNTIFELKIKVKHFKTSNEYSLLIPRVIVFNPFDWGFGSQNFN